jgi:hypothetical protein
VEDDITVEERLQRLEDIKAEARNAQIADTERIKKKVAEKLVGTPELSAAATLKNYFAGSNTDMAALLNALQAEADKAVDGDDSSVQRYMFAQMHIMSELFNKMAQMMLSPSNADISKFKILGDLAAKFQNQSRRTAATLVDIRRPRQKTYIRRVDQINTAQNQQVNNSADVENKSDNEILGDANGERLDGRKTQTTIGANTHLGTVEEEYGAKDQGRENEVICKRT